MRALSLLGLLTFAVCTYLLMRTVEQEPPRHMAPDERMARLLGGKPRHMGRRR